MPFATVNFRSTALARQTNYTAILPDPATQGNGPYPVLYQLHGRGDTHSTWLTQTRLVSYVARTPFIIVMPEGEGLWWCNVSNSQRWEDFLMQDLPAHLAATFHVRSDRAGTAIGGLSMGGAASLRLALRYPDRFASVAAHSSAVMPMEEWGPQRDIPRVPENDVYAVASQVDPAKAPAIRFDCGTEDRLIEHNRRFRDHLQRLGVAHEYAEYPGVHNWDYWDEHVKEALTHHCRALGLACA